MVLLNQDRLKVENDWTHPVVSQQMQTTSPPNHFLYHSSWRCIKDNSGSLISPRGDHLPLSPSVWILATLRLSQSPYLHFVSSVPQQHKKTVNSAVRTTFTPTPSRRLPFSRIFLERASAAAERPMAIATYFSTETNQMPLSALMENDVDMDWKRMELEVLETCKHGGRVEFSLSRCRAIYYDSSGVHILLLLLLLLLDLRLMLTLTFASFRKNTDMSANSVRCIQCILLYGKKHYAMSMRPNADDERNSDFFFLFSNHNQLTIRHWVGWSNIRGAGWCRIIQKMMDWQKHIGTYATLISCMVNTRKIFD